MIGNSGPRTTLLAGTAAPSASVPAPAASGGSRRTRVLVLAGAAALALVAIGAFVLVNNSGGDAAGPVPTHAARTTSPGGSASATTSGTPGVTVPSTGRNPFLLPPGLSGPGTTTTDASAGSTTAPPTSNSASTTSNSTPATTPTVTTTVTATPLYVGLYGFSGSKGIFWVNDTKYTVAVGETFAGFTFASKSSASCARVSKSGTTTTICSGTVKQFG